MKTLNIIIVSLFLFVIIALGGCKKEKHVVSIEEEIQAHAAQAHTLEWYFVVVSEPRQLGSLDNLPIKTVLLRDENSGEVSTALVASDKSLKWGDRVNVTIVSHLYINGFCDIEPTAQTVLVVK